MESLRALAECVLGWQVVEATKLCKSKLAQALFKGMTGTPRKAAIARLRLNDDYLVVRKANGAWITSATSVNQAKVMVKLEAAARWMAGSTNAGPGAEHQQGGGEPGDQDDTMAVEPQAAVAAEPTVEAEAAAAVAAEPTVEGPHATVHIQPITAAQEPGSPMEPEVHGESGATQGRLAALPGPVLHLLWPDPMPHPDTEPRGTQLPGLGNRGVVCRTPGN